MNDSQSLFVEELRKVVESDKNFNVYFYDEYKALIEDVRNGCAVNATEKRIKRRCQRFGLARIGIKEYLVERKTDRYFAPAEDMYKIIEEVHRSTNHGGRDRILHEVGKTYSNITRQIVNLFIQYCQRCQVKRPSSRRSIVMRPVLSDRFNARVQVDLIDWQTAADSLGYKYILNYQDHFTKYCLLRPLRFKSGTAVAEALVQIFCDFGAPCILQSDNGREFVNSVIKELKDMWPELSIINGSACHSRSQGFVEQANYDVQQMLRCYTRDHPGQAWSECLKFVQHQKNAAVHRLLGKSPYSALFGCEPIQSTCNTPLPVNVLRTVKAEEHCEEMLAERREHSSGRRQRVTSLSESEK